MRLPLVVLVILSVAPLSAQQPAAPAKPTPKPKAGDATKPKVLPATPTPTPKPGVFKRIFGGTPKATPTPAPTPTPKPKTIGPRPRPTPRPAVEVTDPATPANSRRTPRPNTKPPKNTDPAPTDDATKYKTARTAALEDEQIKELKNKADSALDEAEAHRASIAYNKALFRKIRQLEPSIDAYVDQLEAAMMKRLNAEKAD